MYNQRSSAEKKKTSKKATNEYANELLDPVDQLDIVDEFDRTVSDFTIYLKQQKTIDSSVPSVQHPISTAGGRRSTNQRSRVAASARADVLLDDEDQSNFVHNDDIDESESLPPDLPPRSATFVEGDDDEELELNLSQDLALGRRPLLDTPPSAIALPKPFQESFYETSSGRMVDRAELQRKIRELWQDALGWRDFSHQYPRQYHDLKRELQYPAMLNDSLERFNVRFTMLFDNPTIVYPRYRRSRADNGHRTVFPTGLKLITLNYSSANPQSRLEKTTLPDEKEVPMHEYYPGIFGWHVLTPADKKVFICSNERDAMSIWWATEQLSIALPKGDILDRQTEVCLEQFSEVTLWFTPAQREAMKQIAFSLTAPRIYYILASERSFEILRKNLNKRSINAVLQNGSRVAVRDQPLPPKGLFSQVAERKDEIVESLSGHGSRLRGIAQFQRFAILNTILGGFREGEITVLTGPTGHGKTTFLCEFALDLLQQEIRTLFCSFEMSDTQILYLDGRSVPQVFVVYCISRGNLNKHDVDKQVDQFTRSNKGLIMMNTGAFRNETPGVIADSIRQEVLAAGIQHVVIDNLQFLIGAAHLTANGVRADSSFDKWAVQDSFLHQMRRLADETKVHITIVVHPRKEPDDVTVQSFSGSAKVTQEADNVLVIQKRKRGEHVDGRPIFTKFLYIMKNRFTGNKVEYDRLEMKFDRTSFCHRLEDRDKDN